MSHEPKLRAGLHCSRSYTLSGFTHSLMRPTNLTELAAEREFCIVRLPEYTVPIHTRGQIRSKYRPITEEVYNSLLSAITEYITITPKRCLRCVIKLWRSLCCHVLTSSEHITAQRTAHLAIKTTSTSTMSYYTNTFQLWEGISMENDHPPHH